MAGNTVNLEFAGDATKLAKASDKADKSISKVGESATSAGDDFKASGKESGDFLTKIGSLGAGVGGLSDAIDNAGGTLDAFNQLQNAGKERAQAQKRALNDVAQAQEDYNQALRDGAQAAIDQDQAAVDLEQATLDQATALTDYNKAVKEHGKRSVEARQAQIDLKQAGVDLKQANEDSAQFTRDAAQATIDATGAQLDLNDAQSAAKPSDLSKWSTDLQMISPLLSGLVGIFGLVTAAQWAWNAAMTANPIGLIIVLVAAAIAIIVVIATKTTWFQTIWKVAWGGIKSAAENVWKWLSDLPKKLKNVFASVANFISLPFRTAFNLISTAWNNTIGRLAWTVPGWIPGIGGQTIGAPKLPHFHQGGTVPGAPGQEVLSVLQGGEEVKTRASGIGDGDGFLIRSGGRSMDDLLVESLKRSIKRINGGNVQGALGVGRG